MQPDSQIASQTESVEPSFNWKYAILAGVLTELFVLYWIVYSEVPGKVFISSWSIILPGIFLMTIALGAVKLLRMPVPRREFLLIYMMLSASGILVGYAGLQLMFPFVTAQFWYQAITPKYARFADGVPPWLAPRDTDALRGLFFGESAPVWSAWIMPCLVWGGFLFMFSAAMICLATLLSRTWIREERLAFPIVALPLEMASGSSPVLRGKLFWAGFLIPVVLESLIALNYYFPSVPALEIKHIDRTSQWFPNKPWSAAAPWYIGFTPFIVGFAYLAPLDIIFSVFFFAFAYRLLHVYGSAAGWDLPIAGSIANRFPFGFQQAIGAYVTMGIILILRAIPRIRKRIRLPDGRLERQALAGLALAILGLWAWYVAVGIAYPVAIALILLLLICATTLARVRAESGVAWAFGPFRGLNDNFVTTIGSANLDTKTLTMMGTLHWQSADMRFLPMPFHVESFKLADASGIRRDVVFKSLLIATIIAIIAGCYFVLVKEYSLGIATAKSWISTNYVSRVAPQRVDNWLSNPMKFDSAGVPYIVLGGLLTVTLSALRTRFLWWPLHPVGYILGYTGTGFSFWTHYLIAWIGKSVIIRYGGMKAYQQSLPFVFGLILGDLLTQTGWSVGATLLQFPVYQFIS